MARVTAIVDGQMRYAESAGEIEDLVGAVFSQSRPGWAARLFAWRPSERSSAGSDGRVSVDQLRVVTDPTLGWAALNFLRHHPRGAGWEGWDSFNPDLPATAPVLPFGRGSLAFPRNASFPLPAIVVAVREYCRYGQRPASVRWQPAQYF